ncbi:Mu transposase C-terminal domain-containing protein [Parachitinimonas caeni]|uniref:DNA-binding protein n=1 Tax=Parachitinimonas caeni TaxID=3031301 RepID=A0ABT7DWK9_9NEIS|nr:Mu transposase C-terminal domain-containing protein [Parachitinimonas caeni]MDK2124457.1 DNA-binding protein [Parachitinimonas caeni]
MSLALKSHYSASELAAFHLPGLPATPRNILERAKRENWASRRRDAQGGGIEYDFNSLPPTAQDAIKRHILQAVVQSPQIVVPLPVKSRPALQPVIREAKALEVAIKSGVCGIQTCLTGLDDEQRAKGDARKGILLAIESIQVAARCSYEAALTTLLTNARQGKVEPQVMAMLRAARSAAGRKGGELPSVRTLKRWLSIAKQGGDLVAKRKQKEPLPVWIGGFLECYRQPSKPTLKRAYIEFAQIWQSQPELADVPVPSIDAVRRAMKKLPADLLEKGRHTGAALKALLPYIERDWSVLRPNDVWVGDGHGLKALVAHPEHGRPFVAEVTLVLDGNTRLAVGWSVSLSENQVAVGDAIRHGISQYGKPLIYYSDNGAGETAKTLDDPLLGILPRLGIHHATGIPSNPQGRGLIERAHQTILLPLAEQFATFRGKKMDRETLRKTAQEIESAQKRGETSAKLPTWAQLIDALEQAVHAYNHTHEHSRLPKKPDGRHYTPAEYYAERVSEDIEKVSPTALQDLFRPHVIRTPERGVVKLFNNSYFSRELSALPRGTEVRVSFDIHDPQTVQIRTLEGVFICQAEWNGNKRAAFPLSFIENLKDQRAERKIKRGNAIIEEAEAERRPTYQLESTERISIPGVVSLRRDELSTLAVGAIEGEAVAVPTAPTLAAVAGPTPDERWQRWWQIDVQMRDSEEEPAEEDRRFWRQYQKSPEYRARLKSEGVPSWAATQLGL